ncbi:helix-turn-helix domain-containing protein [Nocardioides marmoriginsengisoli]|uniref:Helix-turn-helix domain-containing protein n=1 Tax=Nocardioides marmoriginsengisoli TaxID=661483 RepID=A0A3N0CB66_9ACTN|nr:helix-turn-helix domain-containing protein [Nocardioides marmoriginsengisoli]RNL60697.1 helix-turn-helix domain-containing protein [Nocardioides marmoriginsengisoli]
MTDFTVLVLDGAFASGVAATVDSLRSAAALAPRAGAGAPTWRVVSVAGGPVPLTGGLTVDTTRIPARAEASTWVVPGIATDTAPAVVERLGRDDAIAATRALARHARQGGRVAASCSAVFLLAEAGLLTGRRATTTWWLAPLLAARAPDCTVDADRMICADGPVVTAGAAFAQTDLMLHLLREYGGATLADTVARTLVIDARQAQSEYVVPEVLARGDALVVDLVERIESALPHPPSVAHLAKALTISERTLARQVHRATGRSTFALIQSVKIRRARSLLEEGRLSVAQVAEAVGYQDPTALRRAMRKVSGATPSRYRPR